VIEAWVPISVAIFLGCLVLSIAIMNVARALRSIKIEIDPKIVVNPSGIRIVDDVTSHEDDPQETPDASMYRDLTEIQARAFDTPPIVASGRSGIEIDSGDDIRSSADTLSRNLR